MSATRTGIGFDSHSFSDGGTLMLGGVAFAGVPSLKGHSDGDALLHAVIDALLGAAGQGDIGQLFPDTSPEFRGMPSLKMLAAAVERVKAAGFLPAHVDTVVVADRPRLSQARAKIVASVAKALGLPASHVSVKGKTQEGLTWFAEPGGIAVWATATVTEKRHRS